MPNDLSVWTLVLDASPIVQVVVGLLLAASIASWDRPAASATNALASGMYTF